MIINFVNREITYGKQAIVYCFSQGLRHLD